MLEKQVYQWGQGKSKKGQDKINLGRSYLKITPSPFYYANTLELIYSITFGAPAYFSTPFVPSTTKVGA